MYSFSSLHPLPSDSSKGCYIIWVQNTGSQWTMKDNKGPLQWWLSLTRFRHTPISSNNLLLSSDWALKHVERLIFDWYGRGSQILTWHMRYKQRFSPFTFRNAYLVNLRKSHDYGKKEAFLFGVQQHHVSWQGFVADLRISIDPEFLWRVWPHVITTSWDFLWNAVHNKNTWRIWIQKGLRCPITSEHLCHQTGIFYGEWPFSPRLQTLKQWKIWRPNVFVKYPIAIEVKKGYSTKYAFGFLQNKGNCSPRPMNILPSILGMVMAILKWRMLRQQAGRDKKLESQNRVQNHPSDLPTVYPPETRYLILSWMPGGYRFRRFFRPSFSFAYYMLYCWWTKSCIDLGWSSISSIYSNIIAHQISS